MIIFIDSDTITPEEVKQEDLTPEEMKPEEQFTGKEGTEDADE